MVETVVHKLFFTKVERYLLRNQAVPFVLGKRQEPSDSSDINLEDLVYQQSPYLTRLIDGLDMRGPNSNR